MLWRIFTTLPGDSPWHAAAHNGVRSLVFIAKEWSDPETFQVCAFLWHCCRHIWILELVGVALCLLCVSQAVEACILAQCPQLGSFQHRMLLPLQFPRCQRKDVNIREEDSFKFTVAVMQDEKVIAVIPISRSFWFAGEDHVQTSFSFGDILLSQLSVPYNCQYSKSTGLFAVTMLFSHTPLTRASRHVGLSKYHRHLPHPQNPRPQNPSRHPQRQRHPVRFERGHLHHNQRRPSHQQSWHENQNQRRRHHREHGSEDSVVQVSAAEQAARKAQG